MTRGYAIIRDMKVIGFPASGFGYINCFYAALRAAGVSVVEGVYSGRWLLKNTRSNDVVHFHWPSFAYSTPSGLQSLRGAIQYIAIILLLRMRGVKIAWTVHNLYPHTKNKVLFLDYFVRKCLVKLCNVIGVHGSTAEKKVIEEFSVSREKICQVVHGHWCDYYTNTISKERARHQLNIDPNAIVYLFFGEWMEYKNVLYLINTFIKNKKDNEELWLVGECRDNDYKKAVYSLAAQCSTIRLVERYVADDEIQIYMNASDWVVLPYKKIFTSGAAMLALSFGRPVIAPAMGQLCDVIGPDKKSGVLYATNEKSGLVTAFEEARLYHWNGADVMHYARTFSWNTGVENFIAALSLRR